MSTTKSAPHPHSEQDAGSRRSQGSYRPVEDYGIIGNGFSAALIDSRGSVDWLCLPRFDSPSLFGRILDSKEGGFWELHPTCAFESRHSYVKDTNVLQTAYTCAGGSVRVLDFMPVAGDPPEADMDAGMTVVRLVEGLDGSVQMTSTCAPRPDYARKSPDLRAEGTRLHFDRCDLSAPAEWRLNQGATAATTSFTLHKGERKTLILHFETRQNRHALKSPEELLDTTTQYWLRWARKCSYQGPYRDAVVRSALALKLLIYQPTGAIIAAPTTSLPEEIGGERNWDYRFTWIRDASFTLGALLLAGYSDEDDAFFNWISETVRVRRTGVQVLYPITSQGDVTERILDHLEGYKGSHPVRIGNAAAYQSQIDVAGEVLDALYFACQAGGFDPTPVWPHFHPLVDWVVENWQRPGNGLWEVRGGQRHFVYSKVMCWVAMDRAVRLAESYNLDGDVHRWKQVRDKIHAEVLERGWSEQRQAFRQSYEDDVLDASNLLISSVDFIDGQDPRMLSTIDATLRELVVDGLCYRYRGAPEGLSGAEGTFVLCTFWLIDALLLAGRRQEAQDMFDSVLKRASPLGLFAEEVAPESGSHLGNFPQAFSHIGVISAAVSLARHRQSGSVEPERARRVASAHPRADREPDKARTQKAGEHNG